MTTSHSTLNPLRLAAAVLLLGLGLSQAQQLIYSPTGANRDNANEPNGMYFVSGNSNIVVSHLGYYSTNSTTGLKTNHYVGVYACNYINSTTCTNLSILATVTVPAGTGTAYRNTSVAGNFYWMQLDPPLVLSPGTGYLLAAQAYNLDGDWWIDDTTVTCNAYFVGAQGTGTRFGAYGPTSVAWPLGGTTTFTRNGLGKAYVMPGLANLPQGPAKLAYLGPTSLVLTGAQSFTLNAYISGAPTINCQWWQNGAALSGQTTPTLTIPSADPTNTGTYYFTATNSLGGQQSVNISIVVYTVPTNLVVSPTTYGQTQTLYAGANANFAVTSANGNQPFSYYWYTNGTSDDSVSGTSGYSLVNVQSTSPTTIACVVSNLYGTATNTWNISVVPPPVNPYPVTVLADNPVGYWRLNEADNGLTNGNYNAVANDYWGGNSGVYSNTVLGRAGYGQGLTNQFGYSPATDTESSAQFGNWPSNGVINSCVASISTNVTFATPNGSSAAFSVEAWVNGGAQTYDAGIVTIGYGGAEQINLDTGSTTGGPHRFRFYFRDASNTTHGSSTSIAPDGQWHHLVGVVDEVHSNVVLYVDSVPQSPATCNSGIGVLAANTPMSIGSRRGSSTTNYNYQFLGNINDVALYSYALSSNQVFSHYTVAGIGAHCFVKPVAATNINQGSDLTVLATAIGTPPVSCQWYDVTAGNTPLAEQTNATLVIPNIQASDYNGHTLALVTSNSYGQATNQTTITVYSTPVFTQQPTNTFTLYAGGSASAWTVSVATVGPPPIGYNWLSNGVPIANATNATFTITGLQASTTLYSCWASNSLGSSTGGVVTVTILPQPAAPYPAAVLADHPIGYWRLNETNNGTGNNGVLANDYWGGNYGTYSNTILGQVGYSQGLSNQFGYYPATDPTETSAQFGYYTAVKATSNYVANIPNINFAISNASATFSIEAWANGDTNQQSLNVNAAGIVAKGAWANEQFTLDTGGSSYAYRFTMRDARTNIYTAGTSTNLPDSKWHHLVGVLDEVHSNVCLYVDGVNVATTPMPTATNGVLASSVPVTIGSRLNSGGTYAQQFFGTVNDVAIYNYALSASQVTNHYLAAGIAPRYTLQPPATTNVNEGTTLVVPTQVLGTGPLSYQWYDTTASSSIPDQTNATLVIPNIKAAGYNGHVLALTATNIYGQATSASVTVNVATGPATVTITPANPPTMYVGLPIAFTVSAQGTQPFHYFWVLDSNPAPGATDSPVYTYTNLASSHLLSCTVSNVAGTASASVYPSGVAAPADSYGLRILTDQPVAFFRLDEAANATTAYDYVGGHDATYYNAINGLAGFSPSAPGETATGFGMNGVTATSLAYENDQSGSGIPNLDFSKPTGVNAEFSAEAWVNAPSGQANSSPLVAKGYGNGGEQFDIEVYGGHFRFFFRNAANNGTRIVTSPNIAPDGTWHHLVGVCDEANGAIRLYVDGVLNATSTAVPLEGLLGPLPASGPILTSIGARMTSLTNVDFSYQLINSKVAQVALYNYALTGDQVAAHYLAAGVPPAIYVQPSPASYTHFQGPSMQYSASASGSPPLAYQWYKSGAPMPGQNTNTLSFASIAPSDTGSYDLVVTNAFGAATSSVVTLTVIGAAAPYDAQVLADGPLYYWRFNETNGSTAYDYQGGLNATYGVDTTIGVPGPSAPDFAFETNNTAVTMDANIGTSGAGYVTVPAMNLNTNTLTITCWVNPNADITGYNGVVYSRASTYAKGINYIGLGTSRFNMIGYTWNQNNGNTYGWPSGLITPPGQWSFVALTIAPNRAVMYVGNNGVLQAATNAIAHDVEAFNGITCVGADSSSLPGRIFNGTMDEVAVFNYTLSASQVAGLYSQGYVPPAPSVVLNDPADGATFMPGDDVAFDSMVTTNGNTITKVEYFTGTTKLGESTAADFGFTLTGGFTQGSYPLYAQLDYTNIWGAQSVLSGTNNITVGQLLSPPTNVTWGPSANPGYYTLSFSGGQASTWYLIGTSDLTAPKATWPVLQTTAGGSSGSFDISIGASGNMYFMIMGQ